MSNRHGLIAVCQIVGLLAVGMIAPSVGWSADKAAIEASMKRGAAYIAGEFAKQDVIYDGGERSLAALALLKSGYKPEAPPISTVVGEVMRKFKDGKYVAGAHHCYEAGVDATLLADIDPGKYQPQIKAIADYLIGQQLPNGGWDYPTGRQGRGDTSVVQYACLGLWAAARAGIEVPREVWLKSIEWHARTQLADGGFAYVPGSTEGYSMGLSSLNMVCAGLGSMMIAGRHAFPGYADDYAELMQIPREKKTQEADEELGPLQKIDLSQAPGAPPAESPGIDIDVLRNTVRRGMGWLQPRFVPIRNDGQHYRMYYFYTVERMASLMNVEDIGAVSWYSDCSQALMSVQDADGKWFVMKEYNRPWRDTSFALLFLARSTGKILKRTTPDPTYGGGMLTGGKGEPNQVVASRKSATPLDQLLKSLQNPGSIDLEEAQAELIENVQLADRSELVGQKKTLVKLIQHPNPEVRRTAAWAIGRTNDLALARYLIDAIDDPDFAVMIEAHAALSWLSRRFDGFGLPINPLDELSEDASQEEKDAAIRGWRTRARREWGNWYLRVRPYADRGDEFEARLRQRLGEK